MATGALIIHPSPSKKSFKSRLANNIHTQINITAMIAGIVFLFFEQSPGDLQLFVARNTDSSRNTDFTFNNALLLRRTRIGYDQRSTSGDISFFKQERKFDAIISNVVEKKKKKEKKRNISFPIRCEKFKEI